MSESPNPYLTRERQIRIAEFVKTWTYNHLISTTDIPRHIAMEAAVDAANEHARMLSLTIREHMDAAGQHMAERNAGKL